MFTIQETLTLKFPRKGIVYNLKNSIGKSKQLKYVTYYTAINFIYSGLESKQNCI